MNRTVFIYYLIAVPAVAITLSVLGVWASKRSARRLDEKPKP